MSSPTTTPTTTNNNSNSIVSPPMIVDDNIITNENTTTTTATPRTAKPNNNNNNNNGIIVYTSDMSSIVQVPSKDLLQTTDGSVSLIKNFETYGVYMRKEHYICEAALKNACANGRRCRDIHVDGDASVLKVEPIHRNIRAQEAMADAALRVTVTRYARHLPGVRVEVFDHRSRRSTFVDSGNVIVTTGSEEYFRAISGGQNARMQQCTHFHRKLCLRGPQCSFLHVLNFSGGGQHQQQQQQQQQGHHPSGQTSTTSLHSNMTPDTSMASLEGAGISCGSLPGGLQVFSIMPHGASLAAPTLLQSSPQQGGHSSMGNLSNISVHSNGSPNPAAAATNNNNNNNNSSASNLNSSSMGT
eukprot:PhM_4_TR4174/c2_g1_i1/m.78425